MTRRGRPSSYDKKIAEAICNRLAMDESLASICRSEGMPTVTTVYRWRDANDQFREDYARARVDQGHTAADTVTDIRKRILSGDLDPNVGKAAADLAKWEASKRAARDFGDKVDVTSGGEALSEIDDTTRAIRIAAALNLLKNDDNAG